MWFVNEVARGVRLDLVLVVTATRRHDRAAARQRGSAAAHSHAAAESDYRRRRQRRPLLLLLRRRRRRPLLLRPCPPPQPPVGCAGGQQNVAVCTGWHGTTRHGTARTLNPTFGSAHDAFTTSPWHSALLSQVLALALAQATAAHTINRAIVMLKGRLGDVRRAFDGVLATLSFASLRFRVGVAGARHREQRAERRLIRFLRVESHNKRKKKIVFCLVAQD